MISPEDLAKYLSVMREGGCRRLLADGMEIEMQPAAVQPQRPMTTEELLAQAIPGGRTMTEDDWLFAASEGLPVDLPPKPEERQ